MSCTLATLAQCFTLAGIHLDGGLAMMANHPAPPPGCTWIYDLNKIDNPYGIAAVGYSIEFKHLQWDIQFRHQSSIATGQDMGENTTVLSFSWHPWSN